MKDNTVLTSNSFEKIVEKCHIDFHDYDKFSEIGPITGPGPSGESFRADWKSHGMTVMLKKWKGNLDTDDKSVIDKFINDKTSNDSISNNMRPRTRRSSSEGKSTSPPKVGTSNDSLNAITETQVSTAGKSKKLGTINTDLSNSVFNGRRTSNSRRNSFYESLSTPTTPTSPSSNGNSKKIIENTDSVFLKELLNFFAEILELSGDSAVMISNIKEYLHNRSREHKSTLKTLNQHKNNPQFGPIIGYFYENSIGQEIRYALLPLTRGYHFVVNICVLLETVFQALQSLIKVAHLIQVGMGLKMAVNLEQLGVESKASLNLMKWDQFNLIINDPKRYLKKS
ncbi:1300_t:CDS:2 [Gigaspora margarita]|uniref:1300_t:CDS:1 n=1 Tax=Gigaspora margarita TaxID=4874 RepID=A0ABN7VPV3_GIGMA|nr:1300_t:CDS:2 [Gigaspora margarita]